MLGILVLGTVEMKPVQATPHDPQPIQLRNRDNGESWICHPQETKLLCDRSSSTQGKSGTATPATTSGTSVPQPPSATASSHPSSTNDMMLKLIYIGLPMGCLTAIALHELWERHRTARMKAFIQRLERIWEESAQY
ncbi:MAG: hypothetical protein VKJ24_12530 [Synechococcales bacterium]|nr:hypothetical protein [Synechococcales bacterium]